MVVDYLSSQPNRAGYQVSTKQGSGPNWGQDALAKAQTLANQETQATSGHEDGRPATYDSAIDTAYNHSMGIRKGHLR